MSMEALVRQANLVMQYQIPNPPSAVDLGFQAEQRDALRLLLKQVVNTCSLNKTFKLSLWWHRNNPTELINLRGQILGDALAHLLGQLETLNLPEHLLPQRQAVREAINEHSDGYQLMLAARFVALAPAAMADFQAQIESARTEMDKQIAMLSHVKEALDFAGEVVNMPKATNPKTVAQAYQFLATHHNALINLLPERIKSKNTLSTEGLVRLIYREKLEKETNELLLKQGVREEVQVNAKTLEDRITEFQASLCGVVFTEHDLHKQMQVLLETCQHQQKILTGQYPDLFDIQRALKVINRQLSDCSAMREEVMALDHRASEWRSALLIDYRTTQSFIHAAQGQGRELIELPEYVNTEAGLMAFEQQTTAFRRILRQDREVMRAAIVERLVQDKVAWLTAFTREHNCQFFKESIVNYQAYIIEPPRFELPNSEGGIEIALQDYYAEHESHMLELRKPFQQIIIAMGKARPAGDEEQLTFDRLVRLAREVAQYAEAQLAYHDGLLRPGQLQIFTYKLNELHAAFKVPISEEILRRKLSEIRPTLDIIERLRKPLKPAERGFELFDTTESHLLKLMFHTQIKLNEPKVPEKSRQALEKIKEKLAQTRQQWRHHPQLSPKAYRDNATEALEALMQPVYMDNLSSAHRNFFMKILYYCWRTLKKMTLTHSGVPNIFSTNTAKDIYTGLSVSRSEIAGVHAP